MNTEHNLSGMKRDLEGDVMDLAVAAGIMLVVWLGLSPVWGMLGFEQFLPWTYVVAFMLLPVPITVGAVSPVGFLSSACAYVSSIPGMFSVFRLTDDPAWRLVLCVFAPAFMLLGGRLCFMVRERYKLKRQ